MKKHKIREFDTGATRDTNDNKPDPEGFLCPMVIRAYNDYMHGHRKQKDGVYRDADNWQKGIPKKVYLKSLWRHFLDLWSLMRGYRVIEAGNVLRVSDVCCAILFNVMGILHEVLKEEAELKFIDRRCKRNGKRRTSSAR